MVRVSAVVGLHPRHRQTKPTFTALQCSYSCVLELIAEDSEIREDLLTELVNTSGKTGNLKRFRMLPYPRSGPGCNYKSQE